MKEKLAQCEKKFFAMYPEGFDSEEMAAIEKKHKPEKMTALAHELFAKDSFDNPVAVVERMSKLISRSSMVSLFEKPKFKNCIAELEDGEIKELSDGLQEFLYGNEENGFNCLLSVLEVHKIAKWPIMTAFKVYLNPDTDVFVKPTTAKSVLKFFEIEEWQYKPKPSYAFYSNYRRLINDLKSEAQEELQVSNMAFTGFLMMTIE